MDFAPALGLNKVPETPEEEREKLQLYINLKLASSGQPTCVPAESERFFGISRDLLKSYREKNRLLSNYQCPVDLRIQNFLKQLSCRPGARQHPDAANTNIHTRSSWRGA